MMRIVVGGMVVALTAGIAASHETLSFRAGKQPDAKKGAQPESRARIIDEIRTDLDSAVDKLNRQDPGRQTRVIQDRILDNLKKLLEPDDDNPPPQNPDASNPPPKPMNPHSASEPNSPKPETKQQPSTPENKWPQAKPNATPKLGPMNSSQLPPQAKDEPKQERRPGDGGPWDPLPPRHRRAVNSMTGDRFVPRYEDLLREYYRALAEGGRQE